jgi:hypothetical protein
MRNRPLFAAPRRASIGLAAGLATLGGVGLHAEQVPFPKENPRVMLEVPKDWTVAYSDVGLELTAPEKTSFVVAGVVKRSRPTVDAWVKQAADKMKAFGLAFDPDAKPPTPPPQPKPTVAAIEAPSAVKGDSFTFSGAPSLDAMPKVAAPTDKATAPTIDDVVNAAPRAGSPMPKIPFKVVQYAGGQLANKPVDVQLVLFNIGPSDDFLIEQTSDSSDPRAVSIVTSTALVK